MSQEYEAVFLVFSGMNLLNYVDRGIIPGASNEFTSFITHTLHTHHPSLYLGLLQSAFIVGFCLSSLVFGHLIHQRSPFFLIGVGLVIWIVAVFLCGLSYYANSYAFLVFSRMLSGVGEASFMCSFPPFIASHAGSRKGMWMSIFYTAIPVGTAIGYAYGASMAASPFRWAGAFWIEGLLMIPFMCYCFYLAPHFPFHTSTIVPSDKPLLDVVLYEDEDDDEELSLGNHAPTMWQEFISVVTRPVWLCVVAGYAASTAVLIGISTFGSAFFMGLGYFSSEAESSTVFGVCVSIAGLFGTPCGGLLVDKITSLYKAQICGPSTVQEQPSDYVELSAEIDGIPVSPRRRSVGHLLESYELLTAVRVGFGAGLIGTVIFFLAYFFKTKAAFLTLITLGCTFLFAYTGAVNLATILSVHPSNRAFAMALASVCIHVFGDVPSPIITGALKDELAPGCAGSDDAVSTSNECRDNAGGLRLTMLIVQCWMIWTLIFFALASEIARKQFKRTLGDDARHLQR